MPPPFQLGRVAAGAYGAARHVSAEMSLRYGRLFDATVREEYERALDLAKAQLGPVLPGDRTQLPLAAISRRELAGRPADQIASCAGGYCLRAAAQGPCAYAKICEHCPNFRSEASFLPVLQLQRADAEALAADAAAPAAGARKPPATAASNATAANPDNARSSRHGYPQPRQD